MGQKIHPIGFRLGISRGWDSTWFGSKFSYSVFVKDDYKIIGNRLCNIKEILNKQILVFNVE